MFEIFYPHLETIVWIAIVIGFFSILVTWYTTMGSIMDFSTKNGNKCYIFGVSAICSIIVVYFVSCAMLDRVDQNLAVEKQVVILDKWNEDSRYYFTGREGNIYIMEYDLRDNKKAKQYSKLPRTRFKNLEIEKEYTIKYYNRSNILRSIHEKQYTAINTEKENKIL
jgi:hypothetical protein